MENILVSPVMMILIGFILVLLGIGAGLLINSLSEETEPEGDASGQNPPGGRKGGFNSLARLWRDRTTGELVIEMDGKSFLTADGLDATQRAALESAERDLRAWLGMGRASIPPAPAAAAVQQAAAPQPAAPLPSAAAPVMYAAPMVAKAAAAPVRKVTGPLSLSKEEAPAAASTPASMVMQIEDILQDMIAGTPLEQRGLHLIEDPLRGVIVRLDMLQYEGIDSVTDPAAKAALRRAVEEWEQAQ